jgi:hypothetical protein
MGQTAKEAVAAARKEYRSALGEAQWLWAFERIANPGAASQAVSALGAGSLLLGEAVALERCGELQYAKSKVAAARDQFANVQYLCDVAAGKQ